MINGEKIFITAGARADAIVVWATLDKKIGRAAIKSFVVEKGTPGMELVRLDHKLGIRASDTATIRFTDCRVPKENMLGSPEIDVERGFAGVMQTFDNTRPVVAAMAIGVARAALERARELLAAEGVKADYTRAFYQSTAAEAELYRLEADLEAARLLTLQGGLDGRQQHAQLQGSVDGQGQGRPRRQRHHPALRGAVRGRGLRRDRAAGEVGARLEDSRHLRGHAANPAAHHRAQAPRQELRPAQVEGALTLSMTTARTLSLWALAAGMVGIGLLHFLVPEPFVRIVPAALPSPLLLVYLSGGAEIAGGLGLLLPRTRRLAAWGLIALYVAVFPANVNMAVNGVQLTKDGHVPCWLLWARLPLQLAFIGWAYSFTKRPKSSPGSKGNALALLPQIPVTRSIIEAAIRPLNLTGQAQFWPLRSEAGEAPRPVSSAGVNSDGLAVICVGAALHQLIVICRCQDCGSSVGATEPNSMRARRLYMAPAAFACWLTASMRSSCSRA